MKPNPDNFPPQLKAANEAWNAFMADNFDRMLAYTAERKVILDDYDSGKGIITKETHDLRLKECYENYLPYSRQYAEVHLAVKSAERLHAGYRNKETVGDVPYWAPMFDDTLPGNPGYEPTKRDVYLMNDTSGNVHGRGSRFNSDSARK